MTLPLFTIGHSNHEWPDFVGLLKQHRIQVLADVRSQPYSRFTPQFNRDALNHGLEQAGIKYVFLGEELGARCCGSECFVDGKVDYERVAGTALFKQGLERLRLGVSRYHVAIMCAEKEPLDCHRTILVARHAQEFAEVGHILADGSIEKHHDTETRLKASYGLAEPDLFISPEKQLMQAYARRASDIAYRETTVALEP